MGSFGEQIYTPEGASGEAIGKIESHTPKIDAPDEVEADTPFEVTISVGPHPSTVGHSIRGIEVYVYEEGRAFNPILVSVVKFTPAYSDSNVRLVLTVKKSGVIHAIGYCNLHGLWEGRKEIKVK